MADNNLAICIPSFYYFLIGNAFLADLPQRWDGLWANLGK
jgi:hypothetical protein